MKKYYKIVIIVTLLKKKKFIESLRIFLLILLDALKIRRALVYQKDAESYSAEIGNDDLKLFCFSSADDCRAQLADIMKKKHSLRISIERYVSSGRILWVGLKDGIIVSTAYTLQGSKSTRYFFDLKPDEAIISGCQTHPDYQGNGLYPLALQLIINKLSRDGFRAFYLHTQNWNWPSNCGIRKAGFELIGYGWEKHGKLHFRSV